MASQDSALEAQFYIRRENGDLIPLIAVDELPDNISIDHVPPKLPMDSIKGMHYVGTFPSRDAKHVFSQNEKPALQLSKQPSVLSIGVVSNPTKDQEKMSIKQIDQILSLTSLETLQKVYQSLQAPPLALQELLNPTAGHVITGPKQYCSYWLRKGECDYAQQGCLYKHEMPQDLATLNQLGLRDIPQWYRNQYGVGSLLAATGSSAASGSLNVTKPVANKAHHESHSTRLNNSRSNGRHHQKKDRSTGSKSVQTASSAGFQRNKTQPTTMRAINHKCRADIVTNPDSPLYGQPKLRRNETIEDRQYFKALKVVDAYQKSQLTHDQETTRSEPTNLSRSSMLPVSVGSNSTQPLSHSHPAEPIVGGGRGLPINAPPAFMATAPAPSRRDSISSRVTDIELELILEDEARRAKEDAEYQICVARHKAEKARQKALVDSSNGTIASSSNDLTAGQSGSILDADEQRSKINNVARLESSVAKSSHEEDGTPEQKEVNGRQHQHQKTSNQNQRRRRNREKKR